MLTTKKRKTKPNSGARARAHEASVSIGEIKLPKTQAAVTFKARSVRGGANSIIGTLSVSRGSVRWRPNKGTWKRFSWTAFARRMEGID
jgi:hypothetical protein